MHEACRRSRRPCRSWASRRTGGTRNSASTLGAVGQAADLLDRGWEIGQRTPHQGLRESERTKRLPRTRGIRHRFATVIAATHQSAEHDQRGRNLKRDQKCRARQDNDQHKHLTSSRRHPSLPGCRAARSRQMPRLTGGGPTARPRTTRMLFGFLRRVRFSHAIRVCRGAACREGFGRSRPVCWHPSKAIRTEALDSDDPARASGARSCALGAGSRCTDHGRW